MEKTIHLFKSCVVFPGDIDVMIHTLMRFIFRTKTGLEPPDTEQFMIYLTYGGDLLVGLKKDGLSKPLIPLDDLLKAFNINKDLGILED